MQSHAGREEGGVWRVLPVLGDGFWLSYLPEPGRGRGWGRGGRLGVGTEEARGHFLSDRPYWPDKCPQA